MESAGIYDLPDFVLPEGSCMAYRIAANDLPATASIYKKIFSPANRYPFCLLVTGTVADLVVLSDLVLTLSFHHNYYKVDFGIPVLLFEDTDIDKGNTI